MKNSPEKIFGDLLLEVSGTFDTLPDTPCITDSRIVEPGTVFAAIPGTRHNGADFIGDALAKGAAAVIHDQQDLHLPPEIISCKVRDVRSAISAYCSFRADHPDKKLKIYGVTGTNGKTTSAYLLSHILNNARIPCGLISTVEYHDGKNILPPTHTTPDPQTFFPLLATMLTNGMQAAAMEFSSHALAQNRLATLNVHGAIFTNLTGDHLDFHGDMENYYQAKKRLFTTMIVPGGIAAINVDDPFGERLAEELAEERPDLKIPTFGTNEKSGWRLSEISSSADGCSFVISNAACAYNTEFPMPGNYNIYNLAGVLTLLLCDQISPDAIDTALHTHFAVPGRLEKLTAPDGARFFVDYAHTDDALANVLKTLKPLTAGKLIVVFGAGGDRDHSKRPRMGAAAAKYADKIILTNDNPRSEPPLEIIAQIASGIPQDFAFDAICDRQKALQHAVEIAKPEDIVLIAGKGHENYQETAGIRTHFDDREVLRAIFGELK